MASFLGMKDDDYGITSPASSEDEIEGYVLPYKYCTECWWFWIYLTDDLVAVIFQVVNDIVHVMWSLHRHVGINPI